MRINRHVRARRFGHFRLGNCGGKVKIESSVLVFPVGENGWRLFWREIGATTLSVSGKFKGSASPCSAFRGEEAAPRSLSWPGASSAELLGGMKGWRASIASYGFKDCCLRYLEKRSWDDEDMSYMTTSGPVSSCRPAIPNSESLGLNRPADQSITAPNILGTRLAKCVGERLVSISFDFRNQLQPAKNKSM